MQLSKELESRVCNCTGRFNISGWSLDLATGYWIHKVDVKDGKACDKPSRYCSVFECEVCDELTYASKPPMYQGLGYVCDDCSDD